MQSGEGYYHVFIQAAGGPAEVANHFSKNVLMPPNADQMSQLRKKVLSN